MLLPSGQGCPVKETNQMSRKTYHLTIEPDFHVGKASVIIEAVEYVVEAVMYTTGLCDFCRV